MPCELPISQEGVELPKLGGPGVVGWFFPAERGGEESGEHQKNMLTNYSSRGHFQKGGQGSTKTSIYGCFLKWWYPTTIGFPTFHDHFGVFWGYHH